MMLKLISLSLIYLLIGSSERVSESTNSMENCSIAVNNFTQCDPPYSRFCGYAYVESQTPGECDTRIYYRGKPLLIVE